MFGVGENPVYLQWLAEREARREASGAAAAQRAAAVGRLTRSARYVQAPAGCCDPDEQQRAPAATVDGSAQSFFHPVWMREPPSKKVSSTHGFAIYS